MLQLNIVKNLPGGPKSNNVPGLASSIAGESSANVTMDITNNERSVPEKTPPANSDVICSSEVAAGALNVDISAMTICNESMGKRKVTNHTDTVLEDLANVSSDVQGSSKKQKRIEAFNVETGTTEDILVQDHEFSDKSRHPDVGLHGKNELQIINKSSENLSSPESEDSVKTESEGVVEVLELKQSFDSKEGQLSGISSNSDWKQMEKELYIKGLEIFGRNR